MATINPSGWSQVVEEHTGSSPGTLSRRYTYGLDLISQSRWTGSAWETHLYLTDGLGSTRALLNSSGNISDTFVYDAYGTLIASRGSTPNSYLFTGEQWDASIGQYYLRARTLNPGYGRFWTMDNYHGNSQDPRSLHKYLYAHNNPINYLDPSRRASGSLAEQAPVSGTIGYLAAQLATATAKALTIACAAEIVISGTANVVFNIDTTGIPQGPTTACAWRGRKRDDDIPTMYYSLTEFRVIAAHIKEHQILFPVHKELHYLGPFRELAKLNRRRAYGDLAHDPLPLVPEAGWSWDEYPFASTLEGGFGAVAGGIGTTVVAAPNTEQAKQAAKHTNFYLANKLKSGDPFKVEVIP